MDPLLIEISVVGLSGLIAGLVLMPVRRPSLQSVELRFGTDVTADAVAAFLGGVAGLPVRSVVLLDTEATHDGLRHVLHATPPAVDMLRSQLRGVLPSLRLEPIKTATPDWSGGVVLGWSGSHPLLRTDQAGQSTAALLGAFSPLGEDERLLLRWRLSPARGPHFTNPHAGDSLWLPRALGLLRPAQSPPQTHLSALRTKYAGPVLLGQALLAVRAGHPKRGQHLASRVISVLRSRQGLRGRLLQRRRGASATTRLMSRPLGPGTRLSPSELTAVLGWPLDAPQLQGLTLGTAPQLMASPRIPATGRVFGHADWPGAEKRLLAQPVVGALSHLCVAGPSGVGKSSLLLNLITQDMAARRGAIVIDGKGDLADDLLARVPDRRRGDVIVLDPGRGGPVPGLRVFARSGDAELTADLIVGVFRSLFRDSWGVRSDQWMRAGLVLLAGDPGSTLADFPFVFSDDAFRRRLVARLRDPLALATWASFEAMTPAERAQHLASPINKLNEVVGRRTVRAVLAQPAPKLDLAEVMRTGKIVIVRLSAGEIGAPGARLLGALLVHQIFTAVQVRAAIAPERRRPCMVYIDEPKVLGDLPVPIDALYETARGMGVGMCTAVQSLTQLPKELQRAILTNASSLVAYKQSADDATLLARELPGVTPEALQALGRYSAVMKLALGPGDVPAPMTLSTLAPPAPCSDPRAIRAESAARYGVDPQEVDAALAKRHGLVVEPVDDAAPEADEAPLGRRRRTS